MSATATATSVENESIQTTGTHRPATVHSPESFGSSVTTAAEVNVG